MEQWIHQSAYLLRRNLVKSAAGVAGAHISAIEPRSVDAVLMTYAIADRLLDETIKLIARNRDVASDDDEEQLTVAIGLVRVALPNGHPLLLNFLRSASYYRPELESEVAELERTLSPGVA